MEKYSLLCYIKYRCLSVYHINIHLPKYYYLLGSDAEMEKFYLIDFENVHDKGLKNIDTLTKTDHVHIFYTENAKNINLDIFRAKEPDIDVHKVPARKQSLDMHLASYLGYLLGNNEGKACSYVIASKDKDYDNIIEFWRENGKGIKNISRKQEIPSNNVVNQKKTTVSIAAPAAQASFASSRSRGSKRELQARSFFGQHFKKKIYVNKKEEIIQIILGATTRQQVNNELMKLYHNGNQVKEIIEILQPLIKDLPGK